MNRSHTMPCRATTFDRPFRSWSAGACRRARGPSHEGRAGYVRIAFNVALLPGPSPSCGACIVRCYPRNQSRSNNLADCSRAAVRAGCGSLRRRFSRSPTAARQPRCHRVGLSLRHHCWLPLSYPPGPMPSPGVISSASSSGSQTDRQMALSGQCSTPMPAFRLGLRFTD
jgi:hypothetical protein